LTPGDAGLAREIRLPQALALVVGIVVGVAIFVQPAEIARSVDSPEELLAVWLAAGLLALAGALLCAELASSFRDGGGVLRYLTAAFGPAAGFLWAWALFWAIHTGVLAAISVVFARSVRAVAPGLGLGERPLAIGAIVLLTALNVVGVRRGSGLQSALTALKLVALLALVVAGLRFGGGAWATPAAPLAEPAASPEPAGLGGALLAALFTFGGWQSVTFTTAETVAPERTVPRALIGGLLLVLALYLALNVAYLSVLPLPAIAASQHVAADVGAALAGPAGRVAIAGLAALSALGALAGMVLVGPRVWHALAAEGGAPRQLAAVHRRHRTPHVALAVQALWASLLVAFDSYRALYSRALVVEWLFFALLGPAVILLRRRGVPREFSAPLHPLVPILFSATAFALVVDRLRGDPLGTGLGLVVAAAGLPVYFGYRRLARRTTAGAAGPVLGGSP